MAGGNGGAWRKTIPDGSCMFPCHFLWLDLPYGFDLAFLVGDAVRSMKLSSEFLGASMESLGEVPDFLGAAAAVYVLRCWFLCSHSNIFPIVLQDPLHGSKWWHVWRWGLRGWPLFLGWPQHRHSYCGSSWHVLEQDLSRRTFSNIAHTHMVQGHVGVCARYDPPWLSLFPALGTLH